MKHNGWKTAVLIAGLVAVIYVYLNYRAASVSIVLDVRLPRLLLTILCGLILGGVGSVYQIMLNNPLAEPYILGVSSGGALGSIIAIVLGLSIFVPLFAFAGAFLVLLIVWYLSQLGGFFSGTKLLLSGIIMGLFCSSFISLLIYFNQKDISGIIGILMGNLGYIFSVGEWRWFQVFGLVAIGAMFYLYTLSNQLNILASGDLSAYGMGVNVNRIRKSVFVVSSFLIGYIVAYAGIIGFVGLIIPHIARKLWGNDQRKIFVLSSIGGALMLLICDFLAMHTAVIEIPIGVITAFIGCPFFVYVFSRNDKAL